MLSKRVSRRAALCAGAAMSAALAFHQPAAAQSAQDVPPPFPAVDRNGVDLTTGQLATFDAEVSVGPSGQGGLVRAFMGRGQIDNLNVRFVSPQLAHVGVVFGGATKDFYPTGPDASGNDTYAPVVNDGSKLTTNGPTYIFTAHDGTVVYADTAYGDLTSLAGATVVVRPNGEQLKYTYTLADPNCTLSNCYRLQAVTSSLGYMIHYEYAGDTPDTGSRTLVKVTALNLAQEYCDPNANSCNTTLGWETATFSGPPTGAGTLTVTSSAPDSSSSGLVTTYQYDAQNRITQIVRPNGRTETITYDGNSRVSHVTNGPGNWDYVWSGDGSSVDLQVVVTETLQSSPTVIQHSQTIVTDATQHQISDVKDGVGNETKYGFDATGQVHTITKPEGDIITLDHLDPHGNLTAISVTPKGGGAADTLATYTYGDCSTPAICNQPTTIVDRSAQTDIHYDPNSGLPDTITGPAGNNGVRPQTRITYQAFTASYLGSSATPPQYVSGPAGVWKPISTSSCMTLASCAGGADEVRTDFSYGTSTPNNLQLVSRTDRDQSPNGVDALTQYTYNKFGDLKTVDGPLPGAVDVLRYRYDNLRRVVGVVHPDPDGEGAGRPARAEKIFYTPGGQLSYTQFGTVPSQSDTDWANSFVKLYTKALVYDAYGRVAQQNLNDASGTTQSATQYSFFDTDLVRCSTVRMNSADFASLPADACALDPNQGAYGPDRITQFSYDSNDRLQTRTDGLLTSVQRQTEALNYTPNGKLQTFADGKNNLTTFTYDAFDRLQQTNFPDPTTPNLSSSTDYTKNTYDETTWNVSQIRLRGATPTFVNPTYDSRHNLISKDLPTSTTYSYDNFDRPVSVSAGGQTITETYDPLGRPTAESGPLGAVISRYDVAGRRTKLQLPSGFYTTYDYDNADAMLDIKDQTGQALVTFGYDSADRRQTIGRSSGVTTTYGYDNVSRLGSLAQTFAADSSGSDISYSFGYDPSGAIVNRGLSNSSYRTGASKPSTTYGINGLNQITTAGGAIFTYDQRGNLTDDGTKTYAYDAANRLTSAGPLSLSWDPTDRLYQATNASGTTRYVYDGTDIVAEYDANGNEQRRYVHGPGTDEPLIIYEGGTANWTLADERGSIIAVANNSGGAFKTNTYDEYGLPAFGNYGLFQYTGQAWLPDAGLYDYKTRAYSPTWGRFMQADPLGYLSSPNLYAYVMDDPINLIDSFGLTASCADSGMGGPTCIDLPYETPTPTCEDFWNVGASGPGACGASPGDVPNPARQVAINPQGLMRFRAPQPCGGPSTRAGQRAENASKIADLADKGATTMQTLALLSAETGPVAGAFEITAIGLKGVSFLATGVSIYSNLQNGNARAAQDQIAGVAAGLVVPAGLLGAARINAKLGGAPVTRLTKYFSELAGLPASGAGESTGCGVSR